jgi:hypothetical protein
MNRVFELGLLVVVKSLGEGLGKVLCVDICHAVVVAVVVAGGGGVAVVVAVVGCCCWLLIVDC